jgi:hypothetical protein
LRFSAVTENPGGITRYGRIGRNVFRYKASSADNCIFSDRDSPEQRCPGADRRSAFNQSILTIPIRFALQLTRRVGRTRIFVVNEGHTMTNENTRLDGNAFADKAVAADFTMIPDLGPFLDFYERPYLRLVPDLATVKVNERVDAYVTTEFYIRRNPAELQKRIINRSLLPGLLTAGYCGSTGVYRTDQRFTLWSQRKRIKPLAKHAT